MNAVCVGAGKSTTITFGQLILKSNQLANVLKVRLSRVHNRALVMHSRARSEDWHAVSAACCMPDVCRTSWLQLCYAHTTTQTNPKQGHCGLQVGDRVGLLMSQSPETVLAHAAIYKSGAIAVPLFVLFGPEAVKYRLADSGAK